eukprot:115116-Prorocentrum_minimum.AAC.1
MLKHGLALGAHSPRVHPPAKEGLQRDGLPLASDGHLGLHAGRCVCNAHRDEIYSGQVRCTSRPEGCHSLSRWCQRTRYVDRHVYPICINLSNHRVASTVGFLFRAHRPLEIAPSRGALALAIIPGTNSPGEYYCDQESLDSCCDCVTGEYYCHRFRDDPAEKSLPAPVSNRFDFRGFGSETRIGDRDPEGDPQEVRTKGCMATTYRAYSGRIQNS